jgi:hypothetical protein
MIPHWYHGQTHWDSSWWFWVHHFLPPPSSYYLWIKFLGVRTIAQVQAPDVFKVVVILFCGHIQTPPTIHVTIRLERRCEGGYNFWLTIQPEEPILSSGGSPKISIFSHLFKSAG